MFHAGYIQRILHERQVTFWRGMDNRTPLQHQRQVLLTLLVLQSEMNSLMHIVLIPG